MWLVPQLRVDQSAQKRSPYQPVIDSVFGAFESPGIKVPQSPKLSFLMMEILDR